MTRSEVKAVFYNRGADLCGIASPDRFAEAPEGFHPTDVLPTCRSVISFACRFPAATLRCTSPYPYTLARNVMTEQMNRIALECCVEMEKRGIGAIPIPTNDSVPDPKTGRFRSIVSQKHAAQAAGLGVIGRHSLLITPEFGAMVWLGCVLTEAVLEPDELKAPICNECGKCVEACPVHALDDELLCQMDCWNHAFGDQDGAWSIHCHACRDVCPYLLGSQNRNCGPGKV